MKRTLFLLLIMHTAMAEDRIDLEGLEIRGNSELPKSLYIVPWKKTDRPVSAGRPAISLVNDILQPLDRDVFLKQIGLDKK